MSIEPVAFASVLIHQELIKVQKENIRLKQSLAKQERDNNLLKGNILISHIPKHNFFKTIDEAKMQANIEHVRQSKFHSRNVSYTPKSLKIEYKDFFKHKTNNCEYLKQSFNAKSNSQSKMEGSLASSDTNYELQIKLKDEKIKFLSSEIEVKNKQINSLNSTMADLNIILTRIVGEKCNYEKKIESLTKQLSYTTKSIYKLQEVASKHYEEFILRKQQLDTIFKSKVSSTIHEVTQLLANKARRLTIEGMSTIESKEKTNEKMDRALLISKKYMNSMQETWQQQEEKIVTEGYTFGEEFENFKSQLNKQKYDIVKERSLAISTFKKNIVSFYLSRLSWNTSLIEINAFWKMI